MSSSSSSSSLTASSSSSIQTETWLEPSPLVKTGEPMPLFLQFKKEVLDGPEKRQEMCQKVLDCLFEEKNDRANMLILVTLHAGGKYKFAVSTRTYYAATQPPAVVHEAFRRLDVVAAELKRDAKLPLFALVLSDVASSQMAFIVARRVRNPNAPHAQTSKWTIEVADSLFRSS